MQTADELKRSFLQASLRPNKALGQNFLVDRAALDSIAEAAEAAGRNVLEIGPGAGALTEALLARGPARLIAVEKDASLAGLVRTRLPDPRLEVVTADFLRYSPPEGFSPFAAAGNLPYYITTPLSLRLIEMLPTRMVLMVQKEAAARYTALPGDRVYGPLSVLSQVYYHVSKVTEVSRSCFWPSPEVDSAVLGFSPRVPLPEAGPAAFAAFLNQCFAMRRKTLYNNLKTVPALPEVLETLRLHRDVRAEALAPETLLGLFILILNMNAD